MSTTIIFLIGVLVMIPIAVATGLLVRGIREDGRRQRRAEIIRHPASVRHERHSNESRMALRF